MKKLALAALILFSCNFVFADSGLQRELKAHMNFLTDPLLNGRSTGKPGESIAALYIKTEMEKSGYQADISEFFIKHRLFRKSINGKNVISVLKGTGANNNEIILLSAHFDGRGGVAADDDGSGTAALMALSKKISKRKWNRTIVLAAFGGEEIGLYGSKAYVKTISTENFKYAITLDMVGRPLMDSATALPKVFLTGDDGRVPEIVGLFKKAANKAKINLVLGEDIKSKPWWQWRWSSDHASFHNAGIKALMVSDGNALDSGGKMQIHTKEDSKDKIDFGYTEKVVKMMLEVLIQLDKK